MQLSGLHWGIMPFVLRLAVTIPQVSLVFEDVDGFEEYWSSVLLTVPQFGFVLCFFSWFKWGYGFLVRKTMKGKYHPHSFRPRIHAVPVAHHCWRGSASQGMYLPDSWPKCWLPDSCTLKLYFPPLSIQYPLEGSHHAKSTLNKVWSYTWAI